MGARQDGGLQLGLLPGGLGCGGIALRQRKDLRGHGYGGRDAEIGPGILGFLYGFRIDRDFKMRRGRRKGVRVTGAVIGSFPHPVFFNPKLIDGIRDIGGLGGNRYRFADGDPGRGVGHLSDTDAGGYVNRLLGRAAGTPVVGLHLRGGEGLHDGEITAGLEVFHRIRVLTGPWLLLHPLSIGFLDPPVVEDGTT